MGIRKKLMLAFLLTALVPVIVGTLAYFYSAKTITEYDVITKRSIPALKETMAMKGAALETSRLIAVLYGSSQTKSEVSEIQTEFDALVTDYQAAAKEYAASPMDPVESELWDDYINKKWVAYYELSREIISLSRSGTESDRSKRDALYKTDFADAVKARKLAFNKIVNFQIESANLRGSKAESLNSQMVKLIFGTIFLGFLASLAIGFFLSRTMIERMNRIAFALNESSQKVRATVDHLSKDSEILSSASVQQAASVQQTSASLEEIRSMVDSNSQSATESARISENARKSAEDGKKAVDRMVESVDNIRLSNQNVQTQNAESNKKLEEMIVLINEIGAKTKIINDIVFQTKLLSFNASVEAARAGEHGKGFAVVAEEVGNLAQMSGNASKEISKLLEDSIKRVEKIASDSSRSLERLMHEADQTVRSGSDTAQNCRSMLSKIIDEVGHLSEVVSGISVASKEQASGVNEIAKAVKEIDLTTQDNAAVSQRTSDLSRELSQQLQEISKASIELQIIVDGTNRHNEYDNVHSIDRRKDFSRKKTNNKSVA